MTLLVLLLELTFHLPKRPWPFVALQASG